MKSTTPRTAKTRSKSTPGAESRVAERQEMIAMAAYYLAERRGFASGTELEDWLAAEAEIDRKLERSTATL